MTLGWFAVAVGALAAGLATLATLGLAPGGTLAVPAMLGAAGVAGAVAMWARRDQADAPLEPIPAWRWAVPSMAAACACALVLRLWPLHTGHGLPLGYDYGFYRGALDFLSAPDLPLAEAPRWMRSMFPPALPALHNVLHAATGLDSHTLLAGATPVVATLVPLGTWMVVREAWGKPAAGLAAWLAALSPAAFAAFAFLYLKNLGAIILLLGVLLLVARRAWLAAGVTLGAASLWHPPTLVFALAGLVPYGAWRALRQGEGTGWARLVAASLLVALPAWIAWPTALLNGVPNFFRQAAGALGGAQVFAGTYLDVPAYLQAAAAYVALAIAAVPLALRARRAPDGVAPANASAGAIAALAIGGALYLALRLPLHDRFLLMLDLTLVPLAAGAWALAFPKPSRMRTPVALLLVALVALPTLGMAVAPASIHRPVDANTRLAVAWVREQVPADATLLANDLVGPYALAEGGHRTFAPGLFGDRNTRAAWADFVTNASGLRLSKFMAPYASSDGVYVLQTKQAGLPWAGPRLQAPDFELVHKQGSVRVYRWSPP